jgi:hypothetical protein
MRISSGPGYRLYYTQRGQALITCCVAAISLLRRKILQGAHVMEPIRKLYKDDPDIIYHGEEHLAEVLRLLLLSGIKLELTDLC